MTDCDLCVAMMQAGAVFAVFNNAGQDASLGLIRTLADAVAPAEYDGKTVFGSWANMCELHFTLYGVGLGIGRGQKL